MKILAIRGCNLASLEGEFAIDFRSEPLRSAGLFAITGNTGAGKTTILDAMCLALYKRLPRLENVKHEVKVETSGKTTVSENDVRTILRRGKHKGYAEVDFLAVDGNEYRIRWSVSRTNSSPTGNLTAATHDLTNLTTDEHRKLSADESKNELPRLIGLEYEQFTRAVLLAQGKFSAFLKADENEKAEMLERLTGTDIYSRISSRIYARTQEVKKELQLIEAKRQALQLLGADEIAQLNTAREQLLKELEENRKSVDVLKAKLEWIARFETLNSQIALAAKRLEETNARLAAAQPVIEKLKLIDSVQQIRDEYISMRSHKQQMAEGSRLLLSLERQLAEKENDSKSAQKRVAETAAEQERINGEYLNVQPLITEGAQLEKQCAGDSKAQGELALEIRRLEAEHNKNLKEIELCKKSLAQLQAEQVEKRNWFEKNVAYETAIPMIPSIVANIKSIGNEQLSAKTKEKSLATASQLLAGFDKQLIEARKSEEALKQTMSSEIAALRKKLIDGEPCPVCGSRNHEIIEIAANLLEEKQLEKAKEENRLLIEHIEKNIDGTRIEIERLKAAIAQHNEAIARYIQANLGYLQGVADAKELLSATDASNRLTKFASDWNSYKERLVAIGNDITLQQTRESNNRSRVEEIAKELSSKKERHDEIVKEIAKCKERIKEILGQWKSTEEMQEHYTKAVSAASKAFVTATEQNGRIDAERSKLKGQIDEKEKQIAKQKETVEQLAAKVDAFLSARNDGMDATLLDSLLAITHDEIAAMRNNIDLLEKQLTDVTATIRERRENLEQHNSSQNKPAEEEDTALLQERLLSLGSAAQETNNRVAQINAQLLKDENSRAEFSKYSDEYDNTMTEMSHWSTLCGMFGAANGSMLMKMAQGYTLDILLSVANVHLAEMTKRYRLERFSDSNLGIKVIDLDMMSESRSAQTLSGGETFIVSLALSLALSSLSSNRMSIESLFIDEGFGALDKETLQMALMTLERLQSQGRKIGVISHLSEMLEQIPVKISVRKVSPGKSKIVIEKNE